MSHKWNIFFSGELRDGFSLHTVAKNLAQTTKLCDDKIEQLLLVNPPVTLHKNLSGEIAKKYRERYSKLGVVVRISPCAQAKVHSPPLKSKTATKMVQQDKEEF
jgi:hypothetical protein